ncbi:Initiation-specific alpha-1-6-mannosyltransferase [Penicillium macrosclerotiorum]|uniref:Initiation-specific alpha-1-6-mannosyltransferase n=1 Tax=Penicillium macrosclerotiorum TaxID=303699 RepID=UPI00254790A7|nr:Initiation-specific alpha-1-6-mannosyltransferase [Penicillium macrosclerotiorum]KAJ5689485.1 Initiation-specific alpha-1-6-mannosyltransferase [Penicillium macrosclerotiorum]
MPTFRKSVLAALFLLTFIFVIHSSRSTDVRGAPGYKTVPDIFDEEQEVLAQPKKKTKSRQQEPLGALSTSPLIDRLRYQFPYDFQSKFPAYIWQTWKYAPSSVWFNEGLRGPESSWTNLHPGFTHEVIGDDTQRHLIKYLYGSVPDVFEAYDALPLAVMKADFFRYLVLLARGGIYSDIDTIALKPVSYWLPDEIDRSKVGFIVGIEADPDRPDWHDWYSRRLQFCQWTIVSKPGHPILRDMVAHITKETIRMKKAGILRVGKMDKTVMEFTGPGAWTDAVFRYFNNPEYFHISPGAKNITYEDFSGQTEHRKVGDVVVLPITSFSPGVGQMGAMETDHPMAFVKHNFDGKSHLVLDSQ